MEEMQGLIDVKAVARTLQGPQNTSPSLSSSSPALHDYVWTPNTPPLEGSYLHTAVQKDERNKPLWEEKFGEK
ncbi:UNVERIFIED_CONTAM: hypothetical protein K2H54_013165 [Gekko kuhli]